MQLIGPIQLRAVRPVGWGVLLTLLMVALPSHLQAQATTGQIRGQVTDAAGAPVAGATVEAVNSETGFRRAAPTAENGTYLIPLLPPGTYNVSTQRIGYTAAPARTVRVTVGSAVTLNLQVQSTAVEIEGIAVTAARSPVAAIAGGGVATTVGREEIENLPALGRNYTDFINISGLVSAQPEQTTGGQFSIAGQRPSQTNLQVDGVDANNAFFGENRGGSRIPFVFSLNSIREFQIVTNGFDVEYGNYSGGVVNVVTRGGTNRFEGNAYANFRNEWLTGDNFDPRIVGADTTFEPRDYEVTQYAARVSGPIVRDRLFYLFSLDGQRRREPNVPLTREDFIASGDIASADSVARFFQILESRYGIENAEQFYQPYQTTNDVITLFGRIDWNLNDRNRLSARHNFATYSNDFEAGDLNFGYTRSEELTSLSNSFVAELQSLLGRETNNVLRFQFSSEARPRQAKELRPGLEVELGTGRRIGYGGAGTPFQNRMDESKLQVIDNLTHNLGNHTLKVGGNVIYTRLKNRFIGTRGSGEYQFASLADFEAYNPRNYRRRIQVNGQVPYADFGVLEGGFYAQDSWQATPKLLLVGGLRYDVAGFTDNPGRVIEAERAFGIETGLAPTDANNISPRLSLTYDIFGDNRSVVRTGAGYFYGRIPYVLGGNVQQTVLPVVAIDCFGSIAEEAPDAPPSPRDYRNLDPTGAQNPVNCAGAAGVGGVPEYSFWSDDFEYPETFKANLGVTQQLGERTSLSLDLIYSNSIKLYTVRNINLRDPLFALDNEGGRFVFTPRASFSPSTSSNADYLRNLQLSNVFVNYNDGQAQSFATTVEISRRFFENTTLRGSYTYTDAEDNSSFSCCTSFAGWSSPRVGIYGPNQIGGVGDTEFTWGPSDFVRNHVFVLSGFTTLPAGFRVSGFYRLQSGTPWGPEQSGDLNGDGLNFNDRLFIFSPEDLPLSVTGTRAEEQRELYRGYLAEFSCIGDYVGQIVPRNTCRQPWFGQLDLRVAKLIRTFRGQGVELQADFFNVLNGLNSEWGRYEAVTSARRNLLLPRSFDPATGQILYEVGRDFGSTRALGFNLIRQFQVQLGLQYNF